MADLPTRLDLFEIGRRFVLSRAGDSSAEIVDTEGSDLNIFIGASSFMAAAVVHQLADRITALLLDGAEDEDLDRFVLDRYQLPRKGAAAAVVPVTLARPTAAAGAGTVLTGTKLLTLTDSIEYVLLADAVFGASTLSVTVNARAVQAGKEFQVGANELNRFADPSSVFDTTLTVNNAQAASGGEPREPNDVYRERARGFFTAAARGTLAAIESGALTVAGVESADAQEVVDPSGSAARLVRLAIADSSGVSNTSLAQTVQDVLVDWRAGGIQVLIDSSIPQIISIQLALTFQAGVDTVQLSNEIRAAVVEFVNSLGVNQSLLRSELSAVLVRFKSRGLIVDEDTIVVPTGDLVPTAGRTLRVRLEDVTLV